MTEADVYSLIGGLADGQVYPYIAPLNAAGQPDIRAPWVIFTVVSESEADTLGCRAESTGVLQVDVYSLTIDEAREIRLKAIDMLEPLGFSQLSKTQGWESDTGLYRATFEVQAIQ
ncbi:tail completion protein gp17 [Candidatus Pantoea multigeneris]|uniref:DUF3168 domain-containing protein n=1 Tax=Candidatus Pantoea multigeneris TaxID=2608357 RepID=A0ABX0R597_9GAMM|nr:hypothetical protein [Pantoea multigeneris]NIF20580.1 DUF3168 domain-containing protein [Pantoea multigeneris]